mmetsp:Transcript_18217/g.68916  ORF Transcript_18217/g.68916 Transcript_18217/m.68916 type:complete len:411 (-) Transcript_18217:761-1993(-)
MGGPPSAFPRGGTRKGGPCWGPLPPSICPASLSLPWLHGPPADAAQPHLRGPEPAVRPGQAAWLSPRRRYLGPTASSPSHQRRSCWRSRHETCRQTLPRLAPICQGDVPAQSQARHRQPPPAWTPHATCPAAALCRALPQRRHVSQSARETRVRSQPPTRRRAPLAPRPPAPRRPPSPARPEPTQPRPRAQHGTRPARPSQRPPPPPPASRRRRERRCRDRRRCRPRRPERRRPRHHRRRHRHRHRRRRRHHQHHRRRPRRPRRPRRWYPTQTPQAAASGPRPARCATHTCAVKATYRRQSDAHRQGRSFQHAAEPTPAGDPFATGPPPAPRPPRRPVAGAAPRQPPVVCWPQRRQPRRRACPLSRGSRRRQPRPRTALPTRRRRQLTPESRTIGASAPPARAAALPAGS